jgi:hypothetical protein
MDHSKARVFALLLIAVSVAMIYINWRHRLEDHTYSMKMAAFGPVIGIGGIFLWRAEFSGGFPVHRRMLSKVTLASGATRARFCNEWFLPHSTLTMHWRCSYLFKLTHY